MACLRLEEKVVHGGFPVSHLKLSHTALGEIVANNRPPVRPYHHHVVGCRKRCYHASVSRYVALKSLQGEHGCICVLVRQMIELRDSIRVLIVMLANSAPPPSAAVPGPPALFPQRD
eukprot:CAMPEP_0198223044 /NCGR_PEP_ID=MMETSP1445-20131203/90701_1 /TAXON_ID=36898 /ORGANISM="Pyramimonas sp., Strain CCMP2087" /LENGTH=116 /DNA_ID=CAMNT_0043901759 /DNA_START=354 /DNA_END=701 /DNA_ORIENTATION=-